MVHGLLKFPSNEGIIIVQSIKLNPPKRSHVIQPDVIEPTMEERCSSVSTEEVIINEKDKNQKVKINVELHGSL